LIYVEVIECEDVHSSPVPCKMMDSSALRRTFSQDDVAIMSASATSSGDSPAEHQSPRIEIVTVGCANYSPPTTRCEFDDLDCWSQEEDDIIQVGVILVVLLSWLNE
jgi:hypothetical protein